MRTANARRPAADHWSRRRFDAHAVAKPPHIGESAPASERLAVDAAIWDQYWRALLCVRIVRIRGDL